MSNNQSRTILRRAMVDRLDAIATDHAGGFREGFSRARALAELAAVSTDPDLLAEVAARHATAENWYAITAVDLLLEAGAEPDLIDWHVNDRGPAAGWDRAEPDLAPWRRAS